jgi:hypothetical protein
VYQRLPIDDYMGVSQSVAHKNLLPLQEKLNLLKELVKELDPLLKNKKTRKIRVFLIIFNLI